MKVWGSIIVGVLLFLAGIVWTLQGLDVLGQSGGMNGHKIWAVIGLDRRRSSGRPGGRGRARPAHAAADCQTPARPRRRPRCGPGTAVAAPFSVR